MQAATLSPMASILQQGTSDNRSSEPGSRTIITISIYKKNTVLQPTDEGKELTCRKSVYEKHSMQQKDNSQTGFLSGRIIRPTKPVVKTGRSGVKPPNSPSSELGVSSGSEDEGGWGKESEDELMRIVYTVQICSPKSTTAKSGFDTRNV